MNKIRVMLSVCVLVALLFMSTLPAYASSHRTAEGSFDYFPDMANAVIRQAGGNTFVYSTTTDFWTGTFEGSGQSDSTVIMFSSGSASVKIRVVKIKLYNRGNHGRHVIAVTRPHGLRRIGVAGAMGDHQRYRRSGKHPWAWNLVGTGIQSCRSFCLSRCILFGADPFRT